MNELKLRMWIPDKGMVYRRIYDKNWYFHEKENKCFRAIDQRDHIFTLMLSTGLKDKKGIEIYEGDICTTETIELKTIQYSVYWCIEKAKFSLGFKKYQGDLSNFQPLEIVGHVYDEKTRFDDYNPWHNYPENMPIIAP